MRQSMKHKLFLFGEAEKGDFCTPLLLESLPQLADMLGNPPEESEGILYAVQALLFERTLIYYRVKEEGFSVGDYMKGLKVIENKEFIRDITAICLPGVGNHEIIEATTHICSDRKAFLIASQKDLYDFLTN